MRNLKQIALAAMIVATMGITTRAMAASSVTSVNPNLGVAGATGGTEQVEIIGVGLGSATSVEFGTGNAGTNFTLISSTQISVKPPQHAKGIVDVIVKNGAAVVATLTGGYVYTTPNKVLQVSVRMTIGRNCSIAWDAGTFDDDTVAAKSTGAVIPDHPPGNINPFIWWVRDADFDPTAAEINLASVYSTDTAGTVFAADPDNGHTLRVKTASTTNSNVRIDGIASDTVPTPAGVSWSIGNPAVANQFKMEAEIQGTSVAITNVVYADPTVTVTANAHGLSVGESVTIAGLAPAGYNGVFTVASVIDANNFTYTLAGAAALTTTTGTVTANGSTGIKSLGTAQTGAQQLFLNAPATELDLFLRVSTPATTTAANGTTQTCTVSLIASAP